MMNSFETGRAATVRRVVPRKTVSDIVLRVLPVLVPALAFAGALPAQTPPAASSAAQAAPLPLPLRLNSLIHHTGISVQDVTASATFYSKVFGGNNVAGEIINVPTGKSTRYFVRLDHGSVAIGQLGTLGSVGQTKPLIDHIAVNAVEHNEPAWQARLKVEGLRYIASEVFLGPDNIPIQVAGGVGGEGMSAGTQAQLPVLYSGPPLVTCHGFDHIMLRVTDVEQSVAFWQKTFGVSEVERHDGVAWMKVGDSKLGLRKVVAGEMPGYEYQAFRISRANKAKVSAGLKALHASLLEARAYDDRNSIRFLGPDGIETLLVPE
jgi:catechol 2,3-dioxygenase-like lactoylglutathione lyase family enzyme